MNFSDDILQFIPQSHPFVMIDKLLYADLGNATTNLAITDENIFSEDGYFSEAGLLENIAQTIAAANGYNELLESKKMSGGYIAGVKNFEIFFLPKVNDILTTNTVITDKIFNMVSIAAKVMCNDKLAAQCEMKVFSNTNE